MDVTLDALTPDCDGAVGCVRDRIRFTVSATTNAILGLIIGLLFLGKVGAEGWTPTIRMMRGGGRRVLTTSLTAAVRANQVEGSFRNTGGLLYALSVTILISASIAIALHTPSESPPHRPNSHSLQVQQPSPDWLAAGTG